MLRVCGAFQALVGDFHFEFRLPQFYVSDGERQVVEFLYRSVGFFFLSTP
jgi:hypothetical protein